MSTELEPNLLCKNQSWKWLPNLTGKKKKKTNKPLSPFKDILFCSNSIWHIPVLLFSCPVVCNSLWPQGLQHARCPCISPPPRVCPNLCLLHLIFWHCLLLLPSVFPSIRDFSNESSVYIRWLKYWSFSFSISPSSEYSELISLKSDCFVLSFVQGSLRSLLQHHSSQASVLWCSAFSTVQLSQPYVTTGQTIAWTIRTFVGRVASLLFNTLPRFVITFLPRRNCLLIS